MPDCTLHILVKPKSPRNEVVRSADGVMVRVTAPPVGGAANAAVIKTLSDALAIPKSRLTITAGASGKLKKVSINGVSRGELDALIAAFPTGK